LKNKKSKLQPVVFNLTRTIKHLSSLKKMNRDEVFYYTKKNQYDITVGLKESAFLLDNPKFKTFKDTFNHYDLERKIAFPLAMTAPLFYHASVTGSPILNIENESLIQMLRDTDIKPGMLRSVQLPFNEFVICFSYKGFTFEAIVNKISFNEKYMKLQSESDIGKSFYAASAFMYKSGGKKSIVEMYDLDVSSVNTEFKIHNDGIPLQNQEIMMESVKIFNGLFLYLSLPRTVEYIDGHKKDIRKSIQSLKKNFQPANLFNDIQYSYSQNKTKQPGSGKQSHLVRGHFRNQPFGSKKDPKHRTQWIEPYFTGNENIKSKSIKVN